MDSLAAGLRWNPRFGGGISGVEVAGGLVDFLHASRRYYRALGDGGFRGHLVHGTDRLLPERSPSLGRFAHRKMMQQGIDIRLQARAVNVDDRGVVLDSGERINAGTIICTVGTAPNPRVADLPLPKQGGCIAVAPDMSVPGFADVWVGRRDRARRSPRGGSCALPS